MSWRTHPITVKLRNAGRAAGVNRWLAPLLAGRGYETAFERAALAGVRRGDVVWDVGANVGLYTLKFLDAAGAEGKVFAFEPSPANREKLERALRGAGTNAAVVPLALGDRDGAMKFEQGRDPLGATSRLREGAEGSLEVRVARGDSLVAEGNIPAPNMMKVDAEGFELDVLRGMGSVLKSPALRALCIEVHFGLMNERGIADGPRQVEQILAEAGFRCAWPDPSHIAAARSA